MYIDIIKTTKFKIATNTFKKKMNKIYIELQTEKRKEKKNYSTLRKLSTFSPDEKERKKKE
jgi:hypothetical protein